MLKSFQLNEAKKCLTLVELCFYLALFCRAPISFACQLLKFALSKKAMVFYSLSLPKGTPVNSLCSPVVENFASEWS